MTKRVRISLAGLALVLVGTLVVLIWVDKNQDMTPKLSFDIAGYGRAGGKSAMVNVANRSDRKVILSRYTILFEGNLPEQMPMFILSSVGIAPRGSATFPASLSMNLSIPGRTVVYGNNEKRWCLRCFVQRETLSCKLRRNLRKIRWLERHVELPADYEVKSDWFEQ